MAEVCRRFQVSRKTGYKWLLHSSMNRKRSSNTDVSVHPTSHSTDIGGKSSLV
jgi:hypothetical protein